MTNIRKLREKSNMTQGELAAKLGISQVAISHFEQGTRCPRLITLQNMSKIFNCTIDELLAKA